MTNYLDGVVALLYGENTHHGASAHGRATNAKFKRIYVRKDLNNIRIQLCAGNSPGTGEFPAQMASNAENVSIWWRHHDAMISAIKKPAYMRQQTQMTHMK